MTCKEFILTDDIWLDAQNSTNEVDTALRLLSQAMRLQGGIHIDGVPGMMHIVADYLVSMAANALVSGCAGLQSIHFRVLRTVRGCTITNNPGLNTVSYPSLEKAENLVVSANPALIVLDLSALLVVQGTLTVANNIDLLSVKLDSLQEVHKMMTLSDNPAVTFMSLRAISTVGALTLHNSLPDVVELYALSVAKSMALTSNNRMTSLSIDSLATVGALLVDDNPLLHSLDLPRLTGVDADITLRRNSVLEQITMPALAQVSSVYFNKNPVLRRVDMPRIVALENLQIIDNDAVREVMLTSLQKLAASLQLEGTRVDIAIDWPGFCYLGAFVGTMPTAPIELVNSIERALAQNSCP